ncbi:MAG: hypothetical protein AAGA76_12940 [Pseudomonadota bacterium]
MPQLIGLALIGGILWYGYRALKREMERIGRETREAERKAQEAKRGKELVPDENGVYRPAEPDEE